MKELLEILVEECWALQNAGIPACSLTEDGDTTGHWSATLSEMRSAMGTPDRERVGELTLTTLSIGRCFGPTPCLSGEQSAYLLAALWPEGNNHGSWMEWGVLGECLEKLLQDPHWVRGGGAAPTESVRPPRPKTDHSVTRAAYAAAAARSLAELG